MSEFRMRSEDPPFDFSASLENTISLKIEIDAPGFFRRLKDAILTVFGYKTVCCINLTGEDASRLRMAVLESLHVENTCSSKPAE